MLAIASAIFVLLLVFLGLVMKSTCLLIGSGLFYILSMFGKFCVHGWSRWWRFGQRTFYISSRETQVCELSSESGERRAESGERRLESGNFQICWVIIGEVVPIPVDFWDSLS